MEKALPRVRPYGIAEQRRIGAPLHPVSSGVLKIGPSHGEVFETRDSFVDDGAIADGRANDPVPAVRQAADDPLEGLPLDRELSTERIRQNRVR